MKKLSIIGICLIIAGLIIGTSVVAANDWSINNTLKKEEVVKEMTIEKTDIDILLATEREDIKIIKSKDSNIHLRYTENENKKYSVTEDGKLTINKIKKDSGILNFIKFDISLFDDPSEPFTLEIPDKYQGDISVFGTVGNFNMSDLNIKNLQVSLANGKINLSNISAGKLDARVTNGTIDVNSANINSDVVLSTVNGKINLSDDKISGSLSAQTTNGAVSLKNLDVDKNIRIETVNGAVRGNLLKKISDYSIKAKTNNGNSNLPDNGNYGNLKLDIKVSNGVIDIEFAK